MVACGCVGTVDPGSPFDNVEVELQDALLAENEFGDGDKGEFRSFAKIRAARSEEKIFDELLGDRGGSAGACAFEVVFSGDLNFVPVEAVVLVEACVFSGYDGVLKFGRDLCHRKEAVVLLVRCAVAESLESSLRLDRGGGWVDPTQTDKHESSDGPGEGETDRDGQENVPESDGSNLKRPGLNGSQLEKSRPLEPDRA